MGLYYEAALSTSDYQLQTISYSYVEALTKTEVKDFCATGTILTKKGQLCVCLLSLAWT